MAHLFGVFADAFEAAVLVFKFGVPFLFLREALVTLVTVPGDDLLCLGSRWGPPSEESGWIVNRNRMDGGIIESDSLQSRDEVSLSN